MAQTAISNRQRKLMKKGRPRLFGVARQPNGQPSRAKAHVAPSYNYLAPSLVKQANMNPIDRLESRGDITADQARAAFAWVSDRGNAGLPYAAPPTLNLNAVRAAGDLRDNIGATRRYNEACHVLKNRCGVLGHSLAYEAIIQGQLNKVIEDFLYRRDEKIDPAPRQKLVWDHLMLAFKELERHYGAQPVRKGKIDEAA